MVPAEFHARFAARGKIYRYHIHLGSADPFTTAWCWSIGRELDWAAMAAAAKLLRGKHDFWAFSGENDRTYVTTVRDLRRLDIRRRGRNVAFTFGRRLRAVDRLAGLEPDRRTGECRSRQAFAARCGGAAQDPAEDTRGAHGARPGAVSGESDLLMLRQFQQSCHCEERSAEAIQLDRHARPCRARDDHQ